MTIIGVVALLAACLLAALVDVYEPRHATPRPTTNRYDNDDSEGWEIW